MTCNHRDFTVVDQKIEVCDLSQTDRLTRAEEITVEFLCTDGAEMYLYAECNVCGQKKSALVDWTRDWSWVGPVGKQEFIVETASDRMIREMKEMDSPEMEYKYKEE